MSQWSHGSTCLCATRDTGLYLINIFCYVLLNLAGGLHTAWHIRPSPSLTIHAYSNVDWAGCLDTHCSTSGYLIFLVTTLISWCSKKQPTIAHSSVESEYCSLAHAFVETVWVSCLLHELACPVTFATLIYCDKINTTYLTTNPIRHAHTQHIELDYHFVPEKVALGSHHVQFVPSTNQVADLLTKSLHKSCHLQLFEKLVHRGPPSSFRGISRNQLMAVRPFFHYRNPLHCRNPPSIFVDVLILIYLPCIVDLVSLYISTRVFNYV